MPTLQHTTIKRAGATARGWTHESSHCNFELDIPDRTLEFRFALASKGGGITEVQLEIGLDDLPAILEAIANGVPETLGTLSKCTAIASDKCLELLATPITPLGKSSSK